MSHHIGYFFEKYLFFFQTIVDTPDLKAKEILVMGLSVQIDPCHQKKCFPAFEPESGY
ncbi:MULTISPECIES: hypothetical protein [Brevibacillus]|uniref:hypothetical protein n=1 Tax=Brevibacillus TaxID=55080 RepID=UPI000E399450|nr:MULTISPECIES: hypothetical protein [Brevibacillus]RED30097.1 hypothetical protein DES34_105316 [Brevibacillus brevis]TQK74911.1 hypothetical protein FB479_101522 [Brevibacillus sp. AG162]GEC88167.1 hypothetical protein BBR01nite_04980 [Brevibacillus brevis]VEF88644.1 Uncharacterised protein [Brevibacillus brevis]